MRGETWRAKGEENGSLHQREGGAAYHCLAGPCASPVIRATVISAHEGCDNSEYGGVTTDQCTDSTTNRYI